MATEQEIKRKIREYLLTLKIVNKNNEPAKKLAEWFEGIPVNVPEHWFKNWPLLSKRYE